MGTKPKPVKRASTDERIFSGPNSRGLWVAINAVSDEKTGTALYLLACACQKLEGKTERSVA